MRASYWPVTNDSEAGAAPLETSLRNVQSYQGLDHDPIMFTGERSP